jgi:hypothetical protein
VCLTFAAVPSTLAQETGATDIRSALLCSDRDDADEIIRTLSDSDSEIVVRRLVMMLTEGCREVLGPQRYDGAKLGPSGILEIRLHRTNGYVVPLAP